MATKRSTITPSPHVPNMKREVVAAKGAYVIHESFSCSMNKNHRFHNERTESTEPSTFNHNGNIFSISAVNERAPQGECEERSLKMSGAGTVNQQHRRLYDARDVKQLVNSREARNWERERFALRKKSLKYDIK